MDSLKRDYDRLMSTLQSSEPSLASATNDTMSKVLLLAGASNLEHEVSSLLMEHFKLTTGGAVVVVEFLKNKGLARNYHTFFTWESKNANSFFGLFGEGFKAFAKKEVTDDPDLERAVRAFLEIGLLRNQLVHQNYAAFTLNKTAEELYQLYKDAFGFVEGLRRLLTEFDGRQHAPA